MFDGDEKFANGSASFQLGLRKAKSVLNFLKDASNHSTVEVRSGGKVERYNNNAKSDKKRCTKSHERHSDTQNETGDFLFVHHLDSNNSAADLNPVTELEVAITKPMLTKSASAATTSPRASRHTDEPYVHNSLENMSSEHCQVRARASSFNTYSSSSSASLNVKSRASSFNATLSPRNDTERYTQPRRLNASTELSTGSTTRSNLSTPSSSPCSSTSYTSGFQTAESVPRKRSFKRSNCSSLSSNSSEVYEDESDHGISIYPQSDNVSVGLLSSGKESNSPTLTALPDPLNVDEVYAKLVRLTLNEECDSLRKDIELKSKLFDTFYDMIDVLSCDKEVSSEVQETVDDELTSEDDENIHNYLSGKRRYSEDDLMNVLKETLKQTILEDNVFTNEANDKDTNQSKQSEDIQLKRIMQRFFSPYQMLLKNFKRRQSSFTTTEPPPLAKEQYQWSIPYIKTHNLLAELVDLKVVSDKVLKRFANRARKVMGMIAFILNEDQTQDFQFD